MGQQPEPQHNAQLKSLLPNLEINYFYAGNNEKLSVIYNTRMEHCFNRGSSYLTIFDQDSRIGLNFKKIIESAPPEYLLVPKVYSDVSGKLISPRYQKYNYLINKCNIEYLDKSISAGLFKSKFMFAVGSGMTITRQLWSTGLRFREELSFYGVDTEFCHDYSLENEFFHLLDIEVNHSASNESEENYVKFKWRLSKYFEHWRFQLVNHLGISQKIASIYLSAIYLIFRFKNKLKRFLAK
ncbi:hypothetical protein WH43_10495 [Rheinheimera sp. KL1]|uniref:hypothetical protein n=1 Tax=Rheinheimera sp. KL1 TaxID=1635005 RepID=UPI0006A9461D|nr:hypothetical protein [Rheinheimera sp. KL1]KOO58200.1 hypothetical protein WH43_10495 [Rheinheimera sp. KL1]